MDRLIIVHNKSITRLPRLRGDGPILQQPLTLRIWAAPPTRGWTLKKHVGVGSGHGCPAYAGMDLDVDRLGLSFRRLPRLRGDGPLGAEVGGIKPQAAPPTRGWTRKNQRPYPSIDGCPAYAGMDPVICPNRSNSHWLPRLRGDGPLKSSAICSPLPAAPPTRGWTLLIVTEPALVSGCPAYAGMDPHLSRSLSARQRLPRLRGDGPPRLDAT